jgi:DNA-binding CsgD family transcriptional regulator
VRGRERELETALSWVGGAGHGPSGVVLVEGEPGTGKSVLLHEVVGEAAGRGFSLVLAAADELSQSVPFAPLLTALRESLGAPDAAAPGTTDAQISFVDRFRMALENRAAARPVLVSVDDLHWADPATLTTLRTLPRQLASYPLVWNLARATVQHGAGAAMLFDLLERDGAARVTLGPLTDDAVTDVLTDALGAPPDAGLAALALGAAGNPFLLVELIGGLREENAVQIAGGMATLTSAQLPRRVQLVARHRLEHLSGQTRHMLKTMAVLGRSFRLEDAAEMLAAAPAVVLPLVNEALESGILAASAEDFAFRHGLMWQGVVAEVPIPARSALHRQFGKILLAQGGPAIEAAAHLLDSARRGDSAAIAGLDQAADEILDSSPQGAADIALRAFELTLFSDPARSSRAARAAEALTAAGRIEQAEAITRAALTQPLAPASAAQVRCALSSLLLLRGQPQQASAEAEALLGWPQLPGRLRDEALIAQLQALAALEDAAKARSVAEAVLARPEAHGDAVLAGSQVVLAAIGWEDGRIGRGLAHARGAVGRTGGISPDARHFQPLLALAAMLVDLRMLDEASAFIDAAADDFQALCSARLQAIPALLRARLELATGQADAAAETAEKALSVASELGAGAQSSLALSVLGAIALRRGDLRAASSYLRTRGRRPAHAAAGYARTDCLLAEAQVTEAAGNPAAAMDLAADIYAGLPAHRSVLIGDPAAAAWLARTALAAGRNERAAEVARVADDIADRNPAFRVAAAAAAHCRGIVGHDQARLAQAAAQHMDPWARASAAEDLATLLAADGDTVGGIAHLDEALAGYEQAGATRDLARVRRRLRRLGVRRRSWAPNGAPGNGWDSLTETELVISRLVSQGLSNQQVAQQMYVSVHTVASHLRQIFRKLGITSRVELTRQAIEHTSRPEHAPRTERASWPDRGIRQARYRGRG